MLTLIFILSKVTLITLIMWSLGRGNVMNLENKNVPAMLTDRFWNPKIFWSTFGLVCCTSYQITAKCPNHLLHKTCFNVEGKILRTKYNVGMFLTSKANDRNVGNVGNANMAGWKSSNDCVEDNASSWATDYPSLNDPWPLNHKTVYFFQSLDWEIS